MRKQSSTFNTFCKFINSKPLGYIYRTRTMIKEVASTETMTSWKKSTRSTASGKYQTMLKYAGFLEWEKRGQWKIVAHVPEWFTSAHLYTVCGHETVWRDCPGSPFGGENVRRCDMTKEEILAKLFIERNASEIKSMAERMSTEATKTQESAMRPIDYLTEGKPVPPLLPVTATLVKTEESTFFKNPESGKYNQQLLENLMINAGYINSALVILDQAEFLDPVQHARVINIMAQLQDLQRTIEERIEYKRTTHNPNL